MIPFTIKDASQKNKKKKGRANKFKIGFINALISHKTTHQAINAT